VVAIGFAGALSGQGGNPNGCPVPAGIQAVLVNLVAVGPTGAGDLIAWASDQSQPVASVINYAPASSDGHLNVANAVVLQVEPGGLVATDVTVLAQVSGTHLVMDILGFYSNDEPNSTDSVALGANAGNPLGSGTFGTVALGHNALANTTGDDNIAVGDNALQFLSAGEANLALGFFAGANYTGTESGNILLGSRGVAGESNTIRIGTLGSTSQEQSRVFVAGISGATAPSGVPVLVASGGQLGTTASSRRFKEDIVSMDQESDGLMALRPVTFHYRAPYDDDAHLLQYGLIAEEVAKIFPGLVQLDEHGEPSAIRYQFMSSMLLNEVQKQHVELGDQAAELADQRRLILAQRAQLADLAERVRALSQTSARAGAGPPSP
jgi:hypothetical protein